MEAVAGIVESQGSGFVKYMPSNNCERVEYQTILGTQISEND